MNGPVQPLLALQSPSSCLLQARAPLMAWRTLAELDLGETEQVLMPTLERLGGWVLNLPGRAVTDVTVFRMALEAGIAVLQGGALRSDPPLRVAVALEAALQVVVGQLHPMQVSGEGAAIPWGMYSCSLWGWSQAHGVDHVHWACRPGAPPVPLTVALLAGRILSGATLAWLEQHCAEGVQALWQGAGHAGPAEDTGMFALQVQKAARALAQRGLWHPQRPPGKVWCTGRHYCLLWPLAGQDLLKEMHGVTAVPPAASLPWLETLQRAGCVLGSGAGAVEMQMHPLLGRPVQSVLAGGLLEEALHTLWP